MQALLNFLNGKKTAIGAAILSVLLILQLFDVKLPTVSADQVLGWITEAVQVLGDVMAIWGVAHKVVKARAASSAAVAAKPQ